MYTAANAKVIDLTPYLHRQAQKARRLRLWAWVAVAAQYAAAGTLALYGLLRVLLCPGVALGTYTGPLAVLWAVSYLLLLVSFAADAWLCRRETLC